MLPNNDFLMIKTTAMPDNTNYRGDIFGGWLLAQMDLAAGMCGFMIAQGNVATVAVNTVQFMTPVLVGDMVHIYTWVKKVGRTSMTIYMEVFIRRRQDSSILKSNTAEFVLVAIDEHKKPRVVPEINEEMKKFIM